MAWMIYVWLGIALVSLVIEFISTDMVGVWFFVGSIVAMIIYAFSLAWYIQAPVFIAVSLTLLFTVRKSALKLLTKLVERRKNKLNKKTGE